MQILDQLCIIWRIMENIENLYVVSRPPFEVHFFPPNQIGTEWIFELRKMDRHGMVLQVINLSSPMDMAKLSEIQTRLLSSQNLETQHLEDFRKLLRDRLHIIRARKLNYNISP